jgi:cell division septation protein DedD
MKKAGLTERSSLIFGRGIIIVAILIPASLSFILGYFVGKISTRENPEMKKVQESKSNIIQSVEMQPQQEVQSAGDTRLKTMDSEKNAAKEPPKDQKSTAILYTVQVGAFKNAAEADVLKKKLEKKGYKTSMALSEAKKGGGLYKIWVGKFRKREEAEALSAKIKKTEGLQAFVTVKREEDTRQP